MSRLAADTCQLPRDESTVARSGVRKRPHVIIEIDSKLVALPTLPEACQTGTPNAPRYDRFVEAAEES